KRKLSSSIHLYLYRRCCAQREPAPDHLCQEDFRYKEPVEPFVETSALIPLLSHGGAAAGDHPHWV
ncbi:hypothetical protein A2U01_0094342, partial [Trifolium medium]|nr:hypothetical protein [Trifolium medium]